MPMKLSELFGSEEFSFPGNRGHRDMRDYLSTRFADYRRLLERLDRADAALLPITSQSDQINASADLVLEALNAYFSGQPAHAYRRIDRAIKPVKGRFLELSSESEVATWINRPGLYRIRLSDRFDLERAEDLPCPV